MKDHQPILTYLLTFLALSIILKFFGLIDVGSTEILGYAFIFYGISSVYISFGREQRWFLFLGTSVFLSGIVLFIISHFNFTDTSRLVVPSVLFIMGISSLMVYLDNSANKPSLIFSLVFIILGITATFILGSPKLSSFISSIEVITINYWPVAIILAGIIFLIRRTSKE